MGYYIWATAGHELGSLTTWVHNSLTVHDNFDNFFEFRNVIGDRRNFNSLSITYCHEKFESRNSAAVFKKLEERIVEFM